MFRSHGVPRLIAAVAALAALAVCLLGPMFMYRVLADVPLSAKGQSWEIWLAVIGGGVGAGIGRYVHHKVLVGHFGFDTEQEESAWKGRR